MRDPPSPPRGPAATPTRIGGALAVALGACGSALLAASVVDVGRYARFALVTLPWLGTAAIEGRVSELPTAVVIASALTTIALLAWSRARPALVGAAVGALGLVAIAVIALVRYRLEHLLLHTPPRIEPFETSGLRLGGAALLVSSATVALAGALHARALATRLATVAATAPLTIAGLACVAMSTHLRRLGSADDLATLDAVVATGDMALSAIFVTTLVAAILGLGVRASRGVVRAACAWLVLGASAFVLTRPIAADASDTSQLRTLPPPGLGSPRTPTSEVLPRGTECTREPAPLLLLDPPRIDGRRLASPAELVEQLGVLRRNWSILHARTPHEGVLYVLADPRSTTPVADSEPWLRAAQGASHTLYGVVHVPVVWRTRTRGELRTTLTCLRPITLAPDAPIDPSLDWATLLGIAPRR